MNKPKRDDKRGLEPGQHANVGLNADLLEIFQAWPARFSSKVQVSETCWTWTACKTADGYGRYGMGRRHIPRVMLAHRQAFIMSFPDTDISELFLDHLCRNPSCVRPDHLEPVTAQVNILRGRAANASRLCRAGLHPWIPENIIVEPPRDGQKDGVRRCRLCRVASNRLRNPLKEKPTSCPQGHEFTPENTRFHTKRGHRICVTCERVRARKRYWDLKKAAA